MLELTGRSLNSLTRHWGRVMHICVHKVTIIGLDNGLSPVRCQAIIWTNAGILLIRTLGTNFSEILIETHTFLFKKTHLKMSSGKWRPFCLGLYVLIGSVICLSHFRSQASYCSIVWHFLVPISIRIKRNNVKESAINSFNDYEYL